MGDEKKNNLTYKGKPLVRKDKVICYGDANEKYVLVMTILETKTDRNMEVATRVLVQLQTTDTPAQIIKTVEKPTLYDAFDIGEIWLERQLNS